MFTETKKLRTAILILGNGTRGVRWNHPDDLRNDAIQAHDMRKAMRIQHELLEDDHGDHCETGIPWGDCPCKVAQALRNIEPFLEA